MGNIFFDTEAEQINLFDYLRSVGEVKTKEKTKEYSSELPEEIKSFTGDVKYTGLAEFLKKHFKSEVVIYERQQYSWHNFEFFREAGIGPRGMVIKGVTSYELPEEKVMFNVKRDGMTMRAVLYYVTEAGAVYESSVSLDFEHGGVASTTETRSIRNVTISKWKRADLHIRRMINVLNPETARDVLERINPYGLKFAEENELEPVELLIAPQMEQLHKAGYDFVRHDVIASLSNGNEEVLKAFKRLTQPGKNMKEIFKTSKAVYKALKDCAQISTWDKFRKMDKQGKISAENIQRAYEANYSDKILDEISSILGKEYKGKRLFTWDSLQRYLERIDMYEAIDIGEGILILRDYLNMCSQLDMKPRIDGDSLKREHDVTARTVRQRADSVRASKMSGVCRDNQKYDEILRPQTPSYAVGR